MSSIRARRKQTRQSRRIDKGVELTKGQINRIIDVLLHQHFSKNPDLILVDSLLHAVVDDDPQKSLEKFLRYGAPALIRATRRRKRRRYE